MSRHRQKEFGDLLEVRFGRSRGGERPVLLLGHLDTVWPVGTLAEMPFKVKEGRVYGPGVLDMKAGVVMALEPEPGMLVETIAEYRALARAVPELRLALDVGHCHVTGDVDPADAVRATTDVLGTVSIEDMRRGIHLHLPFGEGDMDIPAVLAALHETGCRKLVCVELSRESPRADRAIPEAINWLREHGA